MSPIIRYISTPGPAMVPPHTTSLFFIGPASLPRYSTIHR